jgi:hypothetical protein
MLNFEDLVEGIPVEEIIPNYKNILKGLAAQVEKYKVQEIEAGNGPEPTRPNMSASEAEMFKIKQQSRAPIGATIVREKTKGIKVLSIIDMDTKEEAEEYRTIWKANGMDRKMEIFKTDYCIGGTGFFEGYIENGRGVINVKSPKNVSAFSSDPANNIWADFAVERFTNAGINYFRYSDDNMVLTFKEAKNGSNKWTLQSWENQSIQKTNILPIHNNITSDGIVTGDLELLKPNLDTQRQRMNSLSQGTYWSATKIMILKGVADEERIDPADPTGQTTYNVLDRTLQQIRVADGGLIVLPASKNAGEEAEISQTEESNLTQLKESHEASLNDLARDAGVPYAVLNPSAVPTTTEATINAYMSANDNKAQDMENIGACLELFLSQMVYAMTGEWKEFMIVWAVTEQVTMNNIADTVSKLVTAGIPLPWVVKNFLRGFRPNQIQELLDMIGEQNELVKGQTQFLMGGL